MTLLEELKEFMDNPTGYFEGELKDKVDELIEREKEVNPELRYSREDMIKCWEDGFNSSCGNGEIYLSSLKNK